MPVSIITTPGARATRDDAARFATALAALKLTTPGDFSVSTRTDVERMLHEAPDRVAP